MIDQPYTGNPEHIPLSICLLFLTVFLWPALLQPMAGHSRLWLLVILFLFSFFWGSGSAHQGKTTVWNKEKAQGTFLWVPLSDIYRFSLSLCSYLFLHSLMKENLTEVPGTPQLFGPTLNPHPYLHRSCPSAPSFFFLLPGDSTWLPVLSEHPWKKTLGQKKDYFSEHWRI